MVMVQNMVTECSSDTIYCAFGNLTEVQKWRCRELENGSGGWFRRSSGNHYKMTIVMIRPQDHGDMLVHILGIAC